MRLLHQRHDHAGRGVAEDQPESDEAGDQAALAEICAAAARICASSRAIKRAAGQGMRSRHEHAHFRRSGQRRAARFPEDRRRARRHFSVGAGTAGAAARSRQPPAKTVALDQVDGFLAIDAKGTVTVYSGKVDLGTGMRPR